MFRVIWTAEALVAIDAALAQSDPETKEIIETDLVRLRTLLQYDAPNFGESRDGLVRIGFAGACGIRYRVGDPAEFVRILQFWLVSPRA